jgi:hypothetical protein
MLVTKLLGFPQIPGFESQSGSSANVQGKNCRQQRHPTQAICLMIMKRSTAISAEDILIRIAIRMIVRFTPAA